MSWLEFIAAVLGHLVWPSAVAIIAVIYRESILGLLPRVTKMGPGGVELAPVTQSAGALKDLDAEKISTTKVTPLTDPTAIDIENENKKALDALSDKSDEREEVLLRALTAQQLEKAFFQIYLGIFGSQLRALQILNARSISRSEAQKMLQSLKATEPALSDWTLDRYLNYLVSWKLISEDRELFRISETGRSFLQFLVRQGLNDEEKPF